MLRNSPYREVLELALAKHQSLQQATQSVEQIAANPSTSEPRITFTNQQSSHSGVPQHAVDSLRASLINDYE